ncbi:DUF6493 family protein [Bacteroides sp. 519]|uniref:DUF6493 family protein n=1 Tax=Bacteroides sp. 519 TaxID=2302937 RepID=UPI0013D50FB3|nr:DUF6493 family protein [Bacteroides sp. 519]NDV60625.1 hypothetical protein [Bacteroides sp. 519]
MENQLKAIIADANIIAIIPFLQKLTAEEKQELYPIIKKMEAVYFRKEFFSSHSVQNENRCEIYKRCLFFFLKKSDIAPKMYWKLPSSGVIQEMLEWYRPDWFSDYVNSVMQSEMTSINYYYIAQWTDRKLIEPSPELIANTLPHDIQQIEKYPFVLDEHIWYLFQYPSEIHWANKRHHNFWINMLCNAAESGRIDRMRLLRESILISVRNLDKLQTGWGIDLFQELKPTVEELIGIQQELLTALTSPQSKAVNSVLTILKKICTEKNFDREEFIRTTPMLLSSEVKSIITSTMSVLDAIGKKYKDSHRDISQSLVNVFMCKDETVQTKAVTLFLKYADKEEQAWSALLEPYVSFMFVSVKTLLKDYLSANESVIADAFEEKTESELNFLSEENRIPIDVRIEELPFFVSEVLANLHSYQYYMLADVLIQLTHQVNIDTCIQLEPAYQKACRKLNSDGTSFFESLLTSFFISYVDFLIEEHPSMTEGLQKMQDKLRHNSFKIEEWHPGTLYLLEPFRRLLLLAMNRIKEGKKITLLSTPTHFPCWIHPVTLVERVEEHLQNGLEPDNIDLQLAIQRCMLCDTSEAFRKASELPESEYKYLLLFLFSGDLKYKKEVVNPHWWLTAALSLEDKSVYTEFLDESSSLIPPAYFTTSFDWKIGNREYTQMKYTGHKYEHVVEHTPEINLHIPGHNLDKSNRKLLIEYLFSNKKRYFMKGDLCHLMHSFPHNSDYILRHIFYDDASYVYDPGYPIEVLTALLELKQPLGEFSYLTLSSFMLIAHKEIRLLTAEVWMSYINAGMFNASKAGSIIGRLINENWGFLKRFTDQLIGMINITSQVNKALEQVIAVIIMQVDTPVTNMKKLLEIYKELLAQNQSQPEQVVKEKLMTWKEEASLKKVLKGL